MTPDDFTRLQWLEPWDRYHTGGFEAELKKELGPKHILFGQEAICVGRRYDCDDALFLLPNFSHPLAVVHLTWIGKREPYSDCPGTELYESVEDFVERRMKPDNLEYSYEP